MNEPPDSQIDLIRAEASAKDPLLPVDKQQSKSEVDTLFGRQDAPRTEVTKQTLHSAIVWGLRIAAAVLIASFVVRMWHLIGPEQWLWLSEQKLQKLDSILFSGALGALLTRYLNQVVPPAPPK